jgi:hypothetical protein
LEVPSAIRVAETSTRFSTKQRLALAFFLPCQKESGTATPSVTGITTSPQKACKAKQDKKIETRYFTVALLFHFPRLFPAEDHLQLPCHNFI